MAAEGGGQFLDVVLATADGILVVDAHGIVRFANPAAESVLGRGADDLRALPFGLPLPGAGSVAELDVARPDGSSVVVDMHVAPTCWLGEDAFAVTLRNVTARVSAQRRLRISEERYALAAAGSNDGLWDWDLAGGLVHTSGRLQEMLGYPAEEQDVEPEWWLDRVHAADLHGFLRALDEHLAGESPRLVHELRLRRRDGSLLWVQVRGLVLRKGSHARRFAGSLTDIGERKRAEDSLRRLALHDPLTGLANRALFLDHLQGAVDWRSRRGGSDFAVLFLDLDRFKLVNDSLGHASGDALLLEVARRIEHCVRVTDTVARLGGDEFAVLLSTPEDHSAVLHTVERIQAALGEPVTIGEHVVYTSASIGVALSADVPPEPETVLRYADIAMYQAKAQGRSGFRTFTPTMHEESASRLLLHTALREAADTGALFARYQPIVDLADGTISGFEALLRWRTGNEVLDAASFIDAAEETGVIVPAGWEVLSEACRQVAAWHDAGFPVRVAVNLADRQVADPELTERIVAALAEAGVDGSALQLEITERSAMTHVAQAVGRLDQCRALGVGVLVDDFGTGYSSLTALHQLPLSAFKIDKTFVSRLEDVADIVTSILALARALDLTVVAEGIETREQCERLQKLGCHLGQGYLFGAALDAAEATRLLREQATESPQ